MGKKQISYEEFPVKSKKLQAYLLAEMTKGQNVCKKCGTKNCRKH